MNPSTRDTFTINLISNASMERYPDNTMASFRTSLPVPEGLVLPQDGNWEVAVSEIAHPAMMNNLNGQEKGSGFQIARVGLSEDGTVAWQDLPVHLWVTKGRYHSVDDIIRYMTNSIQTHYNFCIHLQQEHKIDLATTRDIHTDKIKIQASLPCVIRYDHELAAVLGFKAGTFYLTDQFAPFAVDLQRIHAMFIYTDIIEHQFVGDALAPVLRTVPFYATLARTGEQTLKTTQVVKRFNNLEFKRVTQSTISTILLELRDESGALVSFCDVGRVCVTLLFRKRPTTF